MSHTQARPSSEGSASGPLRAVLLTTPDGGAGAAAPLLGQPGLASIQVGSLGDLLAAARDGAVDAAILDPELAGAWPVDAAETAVQALDRCRPLLLLCRTRLAAEQIGHRLGRRPGVLVLAEELNAARLMAALRGLIAVWQAPPPAP